jgi:hypothetical protein
VQLIQIVNQDRGAIGFAQLALVEKDENAGAQDRQAVRAGPLPGYVRRTNAGGAVCH